MGWRAPHLPDDVEQVVACYWDTDVRLHGPSSVARDHMRRIDNEEGVRGFLLEVILRNGASPEVWRRLCNVQTYTAEEVRRDATEFWEWLFPGEALPKPGSTGRGPLRPPKM